MLAVTPKDRIVAVARRGEEWSVSFRSYRSADILVRSNSIRPVRLWLQPRTFCAACLVLCTPASAATNYVDSNNPTPAAPYSDWSTAATNIQDAINVAAAGDDIVVTNGTYTPISVNQPLTVESVNGPAGTLIDGGGVAACAYLTSGASLFGFTLRHGSGGGNAGGVWGSAASAFVSNCVITANAYGGASGVRLESCVISNNSINAGVFGSTCNNCTVVGNHGLNNGGGAYSSMLTNCLILSNIWPHGGDCHTESRGGGAYDCTLDHCTLIGNLSGDFGGGAYGSILTHCVLQSNLASGGCAMVGGGAHSSTLNDCLLVGNSALSGQSFGGGAAFSTLSRCILMWNSVGYKGGGAWYGTLNNCLIVSNSAQNLGAVVGSTLNNCTVVGNSASNSVGGASGTLNNCVLFYNVPSDYDTTSATTLTNCCVGQLPATGAGNFTNPPLFIDLSGGNFRLQSNSPCINSGNNAYAPGPTDLDGNPRIVSGTVDIGAYEFQGPGSIISYAWLQQYGFPTDSSADYADPDGDGMNNWQEWICGTDPTNALSVLKMLAPSNSLAGIVVPWQSVSNRTYFLQRSSDLTSSFSLLATNIPGQAGTTSFTDTNASGAAGLFYRVGIQR